MTSQSLQDGVSGLVILRCPFCGAKPLHGLMKVEHDQLHGEPFQRYEVKCPHTCARKIAPTAARAFALWNTRTLESAGVDDAAVARGVAANDCFDGTLQGHGRLPDGPFSWSTCGLQFPTEKEARSFARAERIRRILTAALSPSNTGEKT